MTLEEAKKILEKEGFKLLGPGKPRTAINEAFTDYESPEICEAMRVVGSAGYSVAMLAFDFDERKARLKEEYEKNTKAPGSAENRIKEDSGVNPALAESAIQFNDALLDEQAKKIKRLGKEIARLNGIIHDKNAILSDVAEELRLSKIREKNLTEVGQKYMKEVEDLREKLADKVVDKINANALKSAESALACKEQLIYYNEKIIAYYKKKNAEKSEVIANLGKELDEKTKLVETVRKGSKEYCDYGIAAGKMIQKMAKVIVNEGPVSSEDFKEYRRLANGGFFMPEISEEELMKLQEKVCVDVAEEGKDLYGVIVLCGKDYIDALKKVKDVWQE